MFKASTLQRDDYTWTALALFDIASAAVPSPNSMTVNQVLIRNDSASNRVFSVCRGAPFPVPAGESVILDLAANRVGCSSVLVETDSITHTDLFAGIS